MKNSFGFQFQIVEKKNKTKNDWKNKNPLYNSKNIYNIYNNLKNNSISLYKFLYIVTTQ